MKVIVSHDVDNMTVSEHKHDLVVPKYLIRCGIEWANGSINKRDIKSRFEELKSNKWQNIKEIIKFNSENNVAATFFIALNNALGLSYNKENAIDWIQKIRKANCDVGIHGIEYKNLTKMKNEFDLFFKITGLSSFGIRMHYLRNSPETQKFLNQLGYLYDSSVWGIKDCYKVQNMWEFPLNIMDVDIVFENGKYQTKSFNNITLKTKQSIRQAIQNKNRYLTVNFHDRYFSDGSIIFKEWYMWIIEYLKEQKFSFINFRDAITELETINK